jgi:hypothetical protein
VGGADGEGAQQGGQRGMRSTHEREVKETSLMDKEARRLKWLLANKRSDLPPCDPLPPTCMF